MKIYDTHCHPHLNKSKDEIKVIDDFFNNGGKYLNLIGTNNSTIEKVLNTAGKYDNVYVCIGIHPCDVYDLDLEVTINYLEEKIINNKDKIVGLGEIGLDYYWFEHDEKMKKLTPELKQKAIKLKKDLQKIFFKAQIKLAQKYKLPIIIHNREAKDDVFEILKEYNCTNFIFHCFSENIDYANKLIKFAPNCKISFSGIISFKNAKEIQEVAKKIDIKHILAETDAPYLTPTPLRGKEENEPFYTKYVIETISNLRKTDCSENIFNNSTQIFGIKKR